MLTNSRGATQLSKYEYTYFYDGNQAGKRETAPSGVRNTSYVYDGLGRLKQESVEGQTTSYTYTYDDFGNRSTMTVTGPAPYNVAYSYDHNNRLLTETKTQGEVDEITRYGYDNNGNQIYKAKEILQPINPSEQESISAYVLGESEDSDVTLSTYDGFNQLIQVIEGTNTLRYTYNADGHRSSKTVNGTTTKHIWDGSQIALELNAAGAVTNKYIRGINLVAADNTAGVRSYYVYNGHGDTVQLTGASGNVIKSYEYDAFGNELNIDKNDTNVFRYTGEYFDKETGTIYLRARYYDPATSRMLSEDSYTGDPKDPLSLNLYTYCKNNPLIYNDPSGHMPVPFLNFASWMYNSHLAGAQEISTYTLTMNIGNIYNGFHEIAQLNLAKHLSGLGYTPILEYPVKGVGEIDVFAGGMGWEVKPVGTSGLEQLDKYMAGGSLIPGHEFAPILGIPIAGKYKMGVTPSLTEPGVANYFFYYTNKEGKKVEVPSVAVQREVKWRAILAGTAVGTVVVATVAEDIFTGGSRACRRFSKFNGRS